MCALMPMAHSQPVSPGGGTLTLVQALQAARDNLEVALARGDVAAARGDVTAADHAPLPVLSAKLSQMDLQHGIGGGNLWSRKQIDKGIGLDWTWERGGKRALRTASAQRALDAAQADLDEVTTQQLLATQAAFFDLLSAQDRMTQLLALDRDAVQLAGTAARRLRAGDLSAQDAARTEIEAEHAHADLLAAQLDRQRASLALGQLIGMTAMADRLRAQAGEAVMVPASPLADVSAALELRPDVRAARARVESARAALKGAQALKRADITIGASIDHYPGTSTRLVELRMQMPLQWSYDYQGEIARAQAQLTQAEVAQEKTERAAAVEMERLALEAQTAAQKLRHFNANILPRARKVAEAAELAYGKGGLPLTDLLDARRTLRGVLLEAIAARTDADKAAAAWQLRSRPNEAALPRP